MADPANQIFLPWVQPGSAATIPDPATERLATDQPAAVSLKVTLTVNGEPLEKGARFYGPGDVTGIDPQQIVRLDPHPATVDFEPNYFPAVEFDRPDFPWLFTPAKADAQGRLRPWLCLIVVRKQEGVELRRAEGDAAPVLTIAPPAVPGRELPDLAESHLWSHAQITGAAKGSLRQAIDADPERTVSRLLCPRRLDPATEYIACVVPAFEVGRKAGLGLSVDPSETLLPAWGSGADAPEDVTLPVYHSWEFRTGAGGDFEELVARLEPRVLPAEVGKRPIDIGHPGFAIDSPPAPDAPDVVLGLEGALRVLDSASDPWPDALRLPFQNALAKLLNAPWKMATEEGGAGDDLVLGPPLYGAWHAAAHTVDPTSPPSPPWLNELNLDPRQRAVAALGTRVVQKEQEELMASAWEQLGDIEKINQRLRQAQLSRAVNERYHVKTFQRLSDERFLRIVAPARSRVVVEEPPSGGSPGAPPVRTLLVAKLAGSFVPQTAVSAPMRKLARPRGGLNRVYARAGALGADKVVALFNAGPVAAPVNDRGVVTLDKVSDAVIAGLDPRGLIWNPGPPGHWERIRVGFTEMLAAFRLSKFASGALSSQLLPTTPAPLRAAVGATHQHLARLFTSIIFREARQVMALGQLKTSVLASLNPGGTVGRAVLAGMRIDSPPTATGDELEPIMDAPTFPRPMYEALRDLSQDFLFPGLEFVPPNTVQLLQTNAKFIESFMVGLNFEMGRELLWRDYPTDQRGTYFQQFWDTGEALSSRPDITPVHGWGSRQLGTTAVGAGEEKLVLLIRGELLRRYPNTVIYAVKAVRRDGERTLPASDPTAPPVEVYPIFRGTLLPDVTFLGFDLTRSEVVAGDGWYFVLQQQPTEPRFGLDDPPFSEGESGEIPELRSWDDLNWGHLAPSAEALRAMSHVTVGAVRLAPPVRGVWGRNSAHMAYITKQSHVRVAIHASELVP